MALAAAQGPDLVRCVRACRQHRSVALLLLCVCTKTVVNFVLGQPSLPAVRPEPVWANHHRFGHVGKAVEKTGESFRNRT